MVWLESAPSRLVKMVDVLGGSASPVSKTTTPSGGLRAGALIVEDNRQMAGGDAVAGLQLQLGAQGNIVHQRAVLAAKILHGPVVAIAFQNHVLARQAGIVRKAQFGGAGTADREAVALQRDGLNLPVRALNDNFPGHAGLRDGPQLIITEGAGDGLPCLSDRLR